MDSGVEPCENAGQALTFGQIGGEMGRRIRTLDWTGTPLGPIAKWPQSLRTVVNILLSSRYAMWMGWGKELTFLFNDAYRPTLGIKDPWALGKPAEQVWAEIWPVIGPRIQTVLSRGEATYDEALLLFLERSGFPEETYHTFSYSPLADDDGRICGMLCVVTEETERIIGERRVETLRDIAAALARTSAEGEVLEALQHHLSRNQKDLPFTLTYLFDDDGGSRLACSSGITGGSALAALRLAPESSFPWPAHEILIDPSARPIEDLSEQKKLSSLPAGFWDKPPEQAIVVPIKQQGQERPAGFLVAAINPYRRYDAAYSGFIDLLAGQIAAALGNARAYEAERRRAEALAELDRAKTTFFSNVSHELRTPLTLMLGPVEELLDPKRSTVDLEERHLLELVHRNGLRLQRLVNTLLDFSRIEAGRVQAHYEVTDLNRYTADLAANFRSAMENAGLEFVVDCDAAFSAPVCVDRDMWEKIVLNLLSNALKFTMEGRVTVSLGPAGDQAQLVVQDTGIGIPADELPHVFERFHRGSDARGRTIEGTGIGLALVHELVKLHGGTIEVESEISKGTRFTLRIPLSSPHLPDANLQTEVKNRPGPTPLRSEMLVQEAHRWGADASTPPDAPTTVIAGAVPIERILLADDNPDMRGYIERLLRPQYQVTAVTNGIDALDRAVTNPPDLILSDVMMPGLDGFALLKELRTRPETKTIPVILISARAGEESQVEGLDSGADDYLIKPFTARELIARVSAHLAMNRRRREAEMALAQSQATLQSFYDSSPLLMGVLEIHAEKIVPIYGNIATANFFGINVDAFPAQNSATLHVPHMVDEAWIGNSRKSQFEGRPVHFEYEHPRATGSRWLRAIVNYLGDGPGGSPRYSFVAEDITERKNQEQLLQKSNDELRRANADLEQFAYSASHDLQEPLRQVAIYSQLLAKEYSANLDGAGSEYLAYCVDGAKRMELLISDLLAYSQAARGTASPTSLVDTNQILETVKKNLAATIRESGAVIHFSTLPAVYADRAPLLHVFQNLISNAIKYRSEESPCVRISAEKIPGFWRFAVEDNGIGIPVEFQEQIFGIFKRLHDRTAYPGTGIGLAICQRVVERYGGRIWVESEVHRGATFFFTLPDSQTQGN